jgi:transglutaminase-like putative cysteine protease
MLPVTKSAYHFSATSLSATADNEQKDAPELSTRVDRYISSYAVKEDGSFTETHEFAMTVLNEQAINEVKQTSVTYSTSIQKIEIVDAYTKKADGHRIDSPKSNFQVETNTGNGKDAPVFSDWTTMTVVFPDVQVGDTVVFIYRLTASEPMFPKQFSTLAFFPKTSEYDDVRIKIDTPASLWTQYKVWDLKEVANTENGGRKVIEWAYSNPHPVKSNRRNYSVYDLEQEPGFEFSTFRDYKEIAQAYGARAKPKAVVTERISKLATEITKDNKTPHDVARSLYEWVALNITYAGNCIGLGAVVPHDTDFILDNRMGDCKDHATLFQSLLAAKGIESTQVLINAGTSYRLQSIPVVSMVNHVINYIPSMNLYADSTSNSTPFGMLPFSDEDKPVLHVDAYQEGVKTPASPPGTNQQIMKTHVTVQEDGTAIGDVEVSLKGNYAVGARSRMRYSKKDNEVDFVKNMYKSMGYDGSGTFEKDDPKALTDTYHFSAKLDVKKLYQYPGAGAFRIVPFFYNVSPVSGYIYGAIQLEDDIDTAVCSNGQSIEEYTYVLPKKMKILSIPEDLKISNSFLSYEAHYHLKKNILSVSRSIDDMTHGNVCNKLLNDEYRLLAQKVLPNLNAPVMYK